MTELIYVFPFAYHSLMVAAALITVIVFFKNY